MAATCPLVKAIVAMGRSYKRRGALRIPVKAIAGMARSYKSSGVAAGKGSPPR